MSEAITVPAGSALQQPSHSAAPRSTGAYACFLLLYIAVNAHMLRNLTVLYILALASIETISFIYIFWDVFNCLRSTIGRWFIVFLLLSSLAAFQTVYAYGVSAGLYACVRFYMVVPIIPFAAISLESTKKIAFVLKCFIAIVCIGVLSIAVQYVIGPISWFAEPGERAGILRFGSILGSLPMIGAALPLAVFGTLMLKMRWIVRGLLLLTLLFGDLISLSKGSVAGTALAVALFLWLPAANKKHGVLALSAISLAVFLCVSLCGAGTVLGESQTYVSSLFSEDSSGRGGDVTMQKSMIDRWTSLPQNSLASLDRTRGGLGLVTGGGFQMVGDALMPSGASPYITSHDTFVDLVLIAGLPLLLSYVCLLTCTVHRLHGGLAREFFKSDPEVGICAFGMMLIIAITCLFTSGLTFQPIVASIWCLFTGTAIRIEVLAAKSSRLRRNECQV